MKNLILEQTEKFIRFKVDDIVPAKKLRKEYSLPKNSKLLYSSFNGKSITSKASLVQTIFSAYADHRPILISPDMVWLTILQGFSHHVLNNKEELREMFVSHNGKLKLTQVKNSLPKGEEWVKVIEFFLQEVNFNLKINISSLVSDFTTTGVHEKIASQITLLEVFQPYFEYQILLVCGIPELTLTGTTYDWIKLKQKVETLKPCKLDWWISRLIPILDEFIQASRGVINISHWQDICKLKSAYGINEINGWITKIYPYLKDQTTKRVVHKNKLLFQTSNSKDYFLSIDQFPDGVSEIIIKYEMPDDSKTREISLVAGFLGISQDRKTKCLIPEIGWQVHEKKTKENIFNLLNQIGITTPPLPTAQITRKIHSLEYIIMNGFSADLMEFYHNTNGLRMEKFGITLFPFEKVEHIYSVIDDSVKADYLYIGELDSGEKLIYRYQSGSNEIVCIDKLDKQFVIEHSLKGFLEKVHESNGKVYFLESN